MSASRRGLSYGYQQTEGLSGAEYLASIYGTEKDKVNCSFYFKVSFHINSLKLSLCLSGSLIVISKFMMFLIQKN